MLFRSGSSRAPSLAHSSKFTRKKRRKVGYKATTIPSTLATIGLLHERYGRLEWQKIVTPSIHIAKKGYKITQLQHDLQVRELENLQAVLDKTRLMKLESSNHLKKKSILTLMKKDSGQKI